MSSLKTLEKEPFEELLGMSGGFVLDFTNDTFDSFFREAADVAIRSETYSRYGDSKAKRLRAFWEIESDPLVGKVLGELLDIWEHKNPSPDAAQSAKVSRCRSIIVRLLKGEGESVESESTFLSRDLSGVSRASVGIRQREQWPRHHRLSHRSVAV